MTNTTSRKVASILKRLERAAKLEARAKNERIIADGMIGSLTGGQMAELTRILKEREL